MQELWDLWELRSQMGKALDFHRAIGTVSQAGKHAARNNNFADPRSCRLLNKCPAGTRPSCPRPVPLERRRGISSVDPSVTQVAREIGLP